MMMAYDSTPTPPHLHLHEETLSLLRAALTDYARSGTHSHELRDALRRASDEAHEKGMPAERVLIALKGIWVSILDVRIAAGAAEQERRRRLQQLVTWCIESYYDA